VPFRHPTSKVNWTNSSFLTSTAVLTFTLVPWYLYNYGIDLFQTVMFLVFCIITGLSITLGYHRLFSHLSFKAKWPVRLLTLIFGAATFENHVIAWASDHRRHHKNVDTDGDPYDISKGFWHAHIGWIMFRREIEPPWDNVKDLMNDPLVRWQQKHYVLIATMASFVLPAFLGWLHAGASGAICGFLISGVARITAVQHSTFFINSLCHTVGSRPYSTNCSARDSGFMALFTFGEGYHNYHHEFQHDYRNGVRWYQWDPTKWSVWTLSKLGLTSDLRRVPEEKIVLAEIAEARRQLGKRITCERQPISAKVSEMLRASDEKLHEWAQRWQTWKSTPNPERPDYLEEIRNALKETRRDIQRAFELVAIAA
jgi:stearoyl-CoA desaturase (delta-9 desaturase)